LPGGACNAVPAKEAVTVKNPEKHFSRPFFPPSPARRRPERR